MTSKDWFYFIVGSIWVVCFVIIILCVIKIRQIRKIIAADDAFLRRYNQKGQDEQQRP